MLLSCVSVSHLSTSRHLKCNAVISIIETQIGLHLHSVDDRVMSAMTIMATAAVMGSAMKCTVELSVVALFCGPFFCHH